MLTQSISVRLLGQRLVNRKGGLTHEHQSQLSLHAQDAGASEDETTGRITEWLANAGIHMMNHGSLHARRARTESLVLMPITPSGRANASGPLRMLVLGHQGAAVPSHMSQFQKPMWSPLLAFQPMWKVESLEPMGKIGLQPRIAWKTNHKAQVEAGRLKLVEADRLKLEHHHRVRHRHLHRQGR